MNIRYVPPTIEQWYAIVDALSARGLAATLEGGGAACTFIGVNLSDGRQVAFGDMNETWSVDIYPNVEEWEMGGSPESFDTGILSSVVDQPELIADKVLSLLAVSQ